MKSITKLAPILFLSVVSLAFTGCEDNASVPPTEQEPPPPPPPEPTPPQDKYGAGFMEAFNIEKFGEPKILEAGDIIVLDKTIDPNDIPDPE